MWRALLFLSLICASAARADEITRYEIPSERRVAIMDAVQVPAQAEILFVSGKVPRAKDPALPREAIDTYGDTEAQALSVLGQIQESLTRNGWTMADVAQMNVYLVPDPKTGRIDFAGFSRAYAKFFDTPENPNRVARSTIGIAQLINPGWLVEIDVTAARMPKEKQKTKRK